MMDGDGEQVAAEPTVPELRRPGYRSPARRVTAALEEMAEHAGDRVWARLRRRPYLGVAVAGGLGVALAAAVGVGEVAFGVLVAYAAYGMLARHEPPSKALRDAAEVERDLIG